MKRSIRKKYTVVIMGILAAIMLFFWLLNFMGLEKFYRQKKIRDIENMYEYVEPVVAFGGLDSKAFQEEIRSRCEKHNITIVLRASSGRVIFASSPNQTAQSERLERYILDQNSDVSEILKEEKNYSLVQAYDETTQSYHYECYGYYPDGTFFIIASPLESIANTASLTNRFLAVVGVCIVALSAMAVYLMTRSLARPVLELSDVAQRMTHLDFTARYEGEREDEIGILGESMNEMSSRLEQTIRELQMANEQLQRDILEKEKTDEMRREFIAGVSHELKTPIALIQGYSEGLLDCVNDDDGSREYYCEVIVDEAQRMNRMVRKLMDLNQLEFNEEAPDLEEFDLVAVARAILERSKIVIEEKGARVTVEAPARAMVLADEFMIEQVVGNYIDNALNHIDGEKRLEVRIRPEGRLVRLSVYNTGEMIPPDEMERIWEKFYKVDKARTRSYGGSGIGLSIVKAVMNRHGQAYGVVNRDEGVEFWFEVEAAQEKENTAD